MAMDNSRRQFFTRTSGLRPDAVAVARSNAQADPHTHMHADPHMRIGAGSAAIPALKGALATRAALAGGLGTMAQAAQAAVVAPNDYKALVCLFMYGGNDAHNWVVPLDATHHAMYRNARGGYADEGQGGLALRPSQLTEINPGTGQASGRRFGMAKELAPLTALYNAGQAAVVANVGPLLRPTTKAQFNNEAGLPPKLFSHNDQQSIWQASAPEGASQGWAGLMADLFSDYNGNPTFSSVSATGNTVLLAGRKVVQYQVGPDGSVTMRGFGQGEDQIHASYAAPASVRALLADAGTGALRKELVRIMQRSIAADVSFRASVMNTPVADLPALSYGAMPPGHPGQLSDDPLAKQLRMVARIIRANGVLGMKRQVFMVSIGGFDNHDQLNREQPALMRRVAQSIDWFQSALGAELQNKVTLFTASDFGRTMASNGKGSDHGWGAHHFAVGGAVRGGRIVGAFPRLALSTPNEDNPDEVGSGRLLPSTSVDQFAAALGRWFGVPEGDLDAVLPNLAQFAKRDIGLF